MMTQTEKTLHIWRNDDPSLTRLFNGQGVVISALPNGGVFAFEHERTPGGARTMINQILGSPAEGGAGRVYLRGGGSRPFIAQALGPGANGRFGRTGDGFAWEGEDAGVWRRLALWLHPDLNCWLWRLYATNTNEYDVPCDAILAQDVGLASRGFLMGNEAYASHYIDHCVMERAEFGPVIMSRQNLAQDGAHPWIAHGCLEGAAGFATDAMQLFGPGHRDAADIASGFGASLPNEKLQHEAAWAIVQSGSVILPPGGKASWTFFAVYEPDHPKATDETDLGRLDIALQASRAFAEREAAALGTALHRPARSVVQDAPPLAVRVMDPQTLERTYPQRLHEEWRDGALQSFFVPDGRLNRHVALADKERRVRRRHGALLRSGQGMLPDETTLCATCWMHGVFAAQLAIGNTSLHKLFTVSRDPYNIGRANGLRILTDDGGGWRALAVPSAFEMGLSDCRWIYEVEDGAIIVHAFVSGEDAAMVWRISVEGKPRRFLVFGQIALGEHEYTQGGRLRFDLTRKRISFRPDPDWLWANAYPEAVFHLTIREADAVEALGGDELLDLSGQTRGAPIAAFRSLPVNSLSFAVVGSLTDPMEARRLADEYAECADEREEIAKGTAFWRNVARDLEIAGEGAQALNALFPWLVHDAMIHLTTPHGLEQTAGAAWGTRDVCQGPVEFLLALEHDSAVKDILRRVFAQQYQNRASWPQWFMFEPYSQIQDPNSHGDVIIWPLKALCDYIECTNDLAFLDEPVAWRREDNFLKTETRDPVAVHVEKLLAAASGRFMPGTHLMRYGEGDWNDSLQPADPGLREKLVSSWTAALFYQQARRYADILRRRGQERDSSSLEALAANIRADFNRLLIRDGVTAGYGLFEGEDAAPELLLHPSDQRTGVKYSLIPMTCAIAGGLFTDEQARLHMELIRKHLLFPDGVRLMDRPLPYHGGVERLFRRAESSAFFGRETGLMYVHAHLRYCEAAAVLGDAEALWRGLAAVNPVAIASELANASARQRNAYFTSSDAAFRDRYEAAAQWGRVAAGAVAVDGGWRVYSSGPGLFVSLLLTEALGLRRRFGERTFEPEIPDSLGQLTLEMTLDGQRRRWDATAEKRAGVRG
jgi:cellobiose phosphorylase